MTSMKTELKIQGMICRRCEDSVEVALLHTRGVIRAEASYWRGSVRLAYDPALASEEEISVALRLAGYPVGKGGISGVLVDVLCIAAVAAVFFLLPLLKGIAIPEATQGASYGLLFLIGLLTSTHCVAMCGGIMLSQTTNRRPSASGESRRSKFGLRASLAYNGGRVLSYTLMGAVFGALGTVLRYAVTVKSMVFTFAGAFVLLLGIQMWGLIPAFRRLPLSLPGFCRLPERTRKGAYGKPLLVGLLTGAMPCGPLSAMWLYAMGTGSMARGALAMLVFALGTLPLMGILGAANAFIPSEYGKYMTKASSVLITAMGLSMLIKGISLFQT